MAGRGDPKNLIGRYPQAIPPRGGRTFIEQSEEGKMQKSTVAILMSGALTLACQQSQDVVEMPKSSAEWISLFDGQTLDGWSASENKETFSVKDGEIVVHGKRSHLFYTGPVNDAQFTNFEFSADVMTEPGSNSGIYVHTEYQETGWPKKGYECQVNQSHSDWKRTASIYDVVNVKESYVEDSQWYTEYIKVEGKHVQVRINGRLVVDYLEPDNVERPAEWPGRKLSSGTFALQGHDPNSIVHYKNIKVRPLP
jgi:hypothetical protein